MHVLLVALLLAPPQGPAPAPQSGPEVLVGAAASLRTVLPELIALYRSKAGGPNITATYGSSGDLRKQVEGGAPLDGVLFASAAPVDALVEKHLADAATRRVIATNQLVLIGPKGAHPLTFATADKLPKGEMLAIGDPAGVPAGQYAKDALSRLGVWKSLAGRFVLGGDVTAVLTYVRRGDAAAGIVYRTDMQGIPDVVLLDQAKGEWAPRPEVVVAVTHGGKNADGARRFLDFLVTPEAQQILAKHGFGAP
jgi:molybdate transport system substrate-binding protein